MLRMLKDLNQGLRLSWVERPAFRGLQIRTKLLIILIPSTILALLVTGITTYWFSSRFLNEAVQRTVRLQSLALAHEVEIFLNQCKEDLLELPPGPLSEAELRQFWEIRYRLRGWSYMEVAYLAKDGRQSTFLVARNQKLEALPAPDIGLIHPDPHRSAEELHHLKKGQVWISPSLQTSYPVAAGTHYQHKLSQKIIRLITPCVHADGTHRGVLLLGVSTYQLRDILSLFNSSKSPIFAYIRSPELRYSYLFDSDGWMWFQSEEAGEHPKELSTHLARGGYSGTFGKPGLESAFKPQPQHTDYWQMVRTTMAGKHGLLTVAESGQTSVSMTDRFHVGYAPVRFFPGLESAPVVYAGVAFVDRSRLGLWAGYRQIDVMFVITLCTTLFISLLIYALSHLITRPIFDLAAAVNRIQETGELKAIQLPDHDYETSFLRYSINNMLSTMQAQMEEIRIRDRKLQEATAGERAKLEDEIRTLKQHFLFQHIQEIVGLGSGIESFKSDILKAASVEADVLIVGETGTGKQLAAEAIHKNSRRAAKPFVSINCGALDENLLLDALFGHVPGAFTEARTNRKGAFLTAQAGTLFLDEIGTASPKVQQALLRALAMRKISPLGSDAEYDVDVRVIAATNEDLKALVDQGRFREDLYYRLNVITMRTPALRDHKEDIPVLADYFLKEAGVQMNKEYIDLTQGALEKMKHYHWPGNVRELKNCITRAVAMAEGSLIHSQDIQLGKEIPGPVQAPPVTATRTSAPAADSNAQQQAARTVPLNERQKMIFAALLETGEITRSQYQELVGNGLPGRTALYDLQDLVRKGIVKKVGRGPAVRYRLVKSDVEG